MPEVIRQNLFPVVISILSLILAGVSSLALVGWRTGAIETRVEAHGASIQSLGQAFERVESEVDLVTADLRVLSGRLDSFRETRNLWVKAGEEVQLQNERRITRLESDQGPFRDQAQGLQVGFARLEEQVSYIRNELKESRGELRQIRVLLEDRFRQTSVIPLDPNPDAHLRRLDLPEALSPGKPP